MIQQGKLSALRQFVQRMRNLGAPRVLIAFGAGLAVGLIAAWLIWPVSWYDTDPSDLRARHKAAYILGVADSLAVTGDTSAAKERIIELTDPEIDLQEVAGLVETVALDQEQKGDKAAALRVRRMAAVTNLPAPGQVAAPIPEDEAPAKRIPTLWIALGLLASLLFAVGAIWGIMYLLGRRAQSDGLASSGQGTVLPRHHQLSDLDAQGAPEGAIRRSESPFRDGRSAYGAAEGVRSTERSRAPAVMPALDDDDYDGDDYDDDYEDLLDDAERDDQRQMLPAWDEGELAHDGPSRTGRDLPRGALTAFTAEYRYGNDDYDVSHSVESQSDEFFGECGLSVCSILEANGAQKVNALQVWLFDKSDRRTVSQILVSQHAYENEALNAQLSAMGELVLAEVGQSVVLETLHLKAKAIIQEVSYLTEASIQNAAFELVNVAFVVERSSALS